ncbi:hypothetical protein MYCTH_98955 [Thermothelomyces thermophilus ATCC 42464]|uniref:Zn(2)-C6 fungal-type domain-containing protein n=1 Tax=Thermothelomyces thermophilus (strain ATCC 42464 / BCRC 31852 / DSM 1799) TaxID=573729 RepID=G2Q367_THET4|nr:uncharacterized protein MYCTH_98955 [Thermothelomyces thermophilus ATCC 42464]AEO53530.1 hypothetical protein MYCTH_98955 [Thermothelomyces thermophilus ATCC 42464]
MNAHCWFHPAHSTALRRDQGAHGTTPSQHTVSMVQHPGGVRSPEVIYSASSELQRHSLATAVTSAHTTSPIPVMSGGGEAGRSDGQTSEPNHDEEDVGGLGLSSIIAPASQKPIRRRMRMITSCLECRRRKLKCAKTHPCLNCKKFQRECVYLGPNLDEASQQRLTEIKEKVGCLERQLERDVAKGATARRNGNNSIKGPDLHNERFVADDVDDDLSEERDLQITPMVTLDLTYDDCSDGNGTDDLIDLGVRVGKMRITERIGGLNRPRISEEIQAGISGTQSSFYGAPGSFASDEPQDPAELPDFLKPGESYLAPSSGFMFGQFTESPALLELLPPRELGHRLMRRYFEAVHPIARCVHRPSLEAIYASFWNDVGHYIEPRASVQAIVFAAWFNAAVSADDTFCRDYKCTRAQLVQHMKIATETALSKAGLLSTTRFETLQGFVMYLLCFLDIRTCEAQGPKPAIRREDYDTKMPVNCDEDQLTLHSTAWPEPAEAWTPVLLSIMRFEINEMMRNIWTDRRKLEIGKTTLMAMITRVENFRKRMLEKYSRMLDDKVPDQKYAKLVVELLLFRLHVMVLHPFHSNTANPLPPKLDGLLVTSGILIIEIAIRLESNPMFRGWAWYLGAYQQYQIALLLATEIYYRPNRREAERIWPCLDWVFRLDPNAPRQQKIIQILTEIASKTSVYMSLRKVRAPMSINRAVPGKQAVKESPPSQLAEPLPPPSQSKKLSFHQPDAGVISDLKAEYATCAPPLPSAGAPVTPSLPGTADLLATPFLPPSSSSMGIMIPPQQQQQQQQEYPQYQHHHQQQQQVKLPPQTHMVFAGVTNGEALWSLPPQLNGSGSPEIGSDGGSIAGQPQLHGTMAAPTSGLPQPPPIMNMIQELDWEALHQMFPMDPQTGELSFATFVDSGTGSTGQW